MEEFINEIKATSTADLMIILEDQLDLYTPEEIAVIKKEMSRRLKSGIGGIDVARVEEFMRTKETEMTSIDMSALEEEKEKERREEEARREAEAREREEKKRRQEEEERRRIEKRKDALRARGMDGYYEYKVISLEDDDGGRISTVQMAEILNSYAMDGWRLKCSYSNEVGRTSSSSGFGGFTNGTNATIDQNILILERFIKLD